MACPSVVPFALKVRNQFNSSLTCLPAKHQQWLYDGTVSLKFIYLGFLRQQNLEVHMCVHSEDEPKYKRKLRLRREMMERLRAEEEAEGKIPNGRQRGLLGPESRPHGDGEEQEVRGLGGAEHGEPEYHRGGSVWPGPRPSGPGRKGGHRDCHT